MGVLSAGIAALATYVLVTKGMQGDVKGTGKLASPAKVESFAQLAKSLAPGYAQASWSLGIVTESLLVIEMRSMMPITATGRVDCGD